MVSPTKKILLLTLLTNACRVLLAIVFMVSGFVKAVDPVGFCHQLKDYADAFGVTLFPPSWLQVVAVLLVAAEFVAGFFLLVGVYRRLVTTAVFAMLLVYTPLTLYIALENPVPDCGCFGSALQLSNWETFGKNVVLLLASLLLCVKGALFRSRVSSRNRWMAAIFAFFYIALLQYMSIMHLPVIDFGPFAPGTDLREAIMDHPSVHSVVAVYEKNGEQRDFATNELPDSSWSFIGSKTRLVSPARAATVRDFAFIDLATDEDFAAEILADTGYVGILAMESLATADESRVDKVNELYDFCTACGIPFYAATVSGEEQVQLWKKRTGAEYPIYWADDVMLKTMVRANPGFVLVHDGRVAGKWNMADIPSTDNMGSAAELLAESKGCVVAMRGWRFWLLLFALPLAFVLFVDMFAGEKKAAAKAAESPAENENE